VQARLYIDEDAMDDDLVQALRLRGVDVQTTLEAGLINRPDDEQLAHASATGRVLYTFNVGDFMQLHGECMAAGRTHAGIIFGEQQRYTVGEQMRRLRRIIALRSAEAMQNSYEFLSSWQ
jgi:Domain of unknown function (DUF5615)